MGLSVGTDPEVFVMRDTRVVPAYFALDGKNYPLPHGTLVGDGAAIEFSVTPSDNPALVAARVQENLHAAHEIVQRVLKDPAIKLVPMPWSPIALGDIQALPESLGSQFSLQILGCAPDESAYAWVHQDRPDPRTYPARTTGGHIHVGLPRVFLDNRLAIMHASVALDSVLNITCQLSTAERARDSAKRRYELYGVPGMHRVSEYGTLEYRCLPAMALAGKPENATWFFGAAQTLIQPMVDAWFADPDDALARMRAASGSLAWVRQLVDALRGDDMYDLAALRDVYVERWQVAFAAEIVVPPDMEIAYD